MGLNQFVGLLWFEIVKNELTLRFYAGHGINYLYYPTICDCSSKEAAILYSIHRFGQDACTAPCIQFLDKEIVDCLWNYGFVYELHGLSKKSFLDFYIECLVVK